MDKRCQDKLGHCKRDLAAMRRKVEAVKAIELPERASEEESQLVGDIAQRIMRALES